MICHEGDDRVENGRVLAGHGMLENGITIVVSRLQHVFDLRRKGSHWTSGKTQRSTQKNRNCGCRETLISVTGPYYVLSAKSISAPLRIAIQKRDHKLLKEFRFQFPRTSLDVGNNGDRYCKAEQCIFHRPIMCNSRGCLWLERRPESSPDSKGIWV